MSEKDIDKIRDYVLEHWGNTVIANSRRITTNQDRIRELEKKNIRLVNQISYILEKSETLLKNLYQQYGEFYFDNEIKEIQNCLRMLLNTIERSEED